MENGFQAEKLPKPAKLTLHMPTEMKRDLDELATFFHRSRGAVLRNALAIFINKVRQEHDFPTREKDNE